MVVAMSQAQRRRNVNGQGWESCFRETRVLRERLGNGLRRVFGKGLEEDVGGDEEVEAEGH